MNDDYYSMLKRLSLEIQDNYEVIIKRNKIADVPGGLIIAGPTEIKDFFNQMNGLEVYWQSYAYKDRPDLSGRINLLSSEKVNMSTKNIVWFDHTPADSPLRQFRLIDFFADEAAVGFLDNDASGKLFYYAFEGGLQSLEITFYSYVHLLCLTKGFFYWQKALLEIGGSKISRETENFKTYLPKIFPGFEFETFIELYIRLRC